MPCSTTIWRLLHGQRPVALSGRATARMSRCTSGRSVPGVSTANYTISRVMHRNADFRSKQTKDLSVEARRGLSCDVAQAGG